MISKHLRDNHPVVMNRSQLERLIIERFQKVQQEARENGSINNYIDSNEESKKKQQRFKCGDCGISFISKKGNVLKHCKEKGHDARLITTESVVRLQCGRYVSQKDIEDFLSYEEPVKGLFRQPDYQFVALTLQPLLPNREKDDNTYTHMYTPIVLQCQVKGIPKPADLNLYKMYSSLFIFTSVHESPCWSMRAM